MITLRILQVTFPGQRSLLESAGYLIGDKKVRRLLCTIHPRANRRGVVGSKWAYYYYWLDLPTVEEVIRFQRESVPHNFKSLGEACATLARRAVILLPNGMGKGGPSYAWRRAGTRKLTELSDGSQPTEYEEPSEVEAVQEDRNIQHIEVEAQA